MCVKCMGSRLRIIAAAFFLSIIFAGEIYIYVCGTVDYDSHAYREENGNIHYSVSSSGTSDYCAVLIDNRGFERVRELLIYVDEGYEDRLEQAEKYHSLFRIDPWHLSEQIKLGLEMRSFTNVKICNSHELITYIEEKMTSDSGYSGCGILSVSYALPGEVYRGAPDDKLIRWIKNGGCLYWTGSVPGEFYINDEGNLEFVKDACDLFFGIQDCITCRSDILPSFIFNKFTESLVMKNNYPEFAVDATKITSEHIIFGTSRGGCVSDILMRYGEGMLAQFSGRCDRHQVEDICQTIASGLCYKSKIDHYECERVTRTTIQGEIPSEGSNKKIFYIFIGKTYPSYGKIYDV